MNILLIGEYSNVHWTLAEGLRTLGHSVTVVSNGDGWKDYPRDISLRRRSLKKTDTARYYLDLLRIMPRLTGYDIVQLINPVFLDLRAARIAPFYRFLRRRNGKVFLGAFGIDHFWVKTGLDGHTFRYSDFNIGTRLRHSKENEQYIKDWLDGEKGQLNKMIAEDCDGIVAGLYEYYACYKPYYADKMRFIPFPVNVNSIPVHIRRCQDGRPCFFIGIQRTRNEYKGTDIMLNALLRLQAAYPQIKIKKVESVPFKQYCRLMDSSHIILDQLYSYTPAMNALQAMAQGLIVVGGGEQENYDILHEDKLRPIINVQPSEEDVYAQLEKLVLYPQDIERLSRESRDYVEAHHDHIKVARQYLDFWLSHPQNSHTK